MNVTNSKPWSAAVALFVALAGLAGQEARAGESILDDYFEDLVDEDSRSNRILRTAGDSYGEEAPADEEPAAEEADEAEKPWLLSDAVFDTAGGSKWKLGGNVAQSFTFNFSSPSDRFNGPVTWTDRSNDYQLNQFYLYLERPTDGADGLDLGGRADFAYGTNYRWSTSAGLEDQWSINTNRSFYGIALPQFYVEAAYDSVKTKFGHFFSPVGYFTDETSLNFFNTLPYTYQYGEPFTHTGMLATWTVNENLAIGSGFTRGWDNWDGSGAGSPNLGYLGTIGLTFEDKSTLNLVIHWSNEFNNNFSGVGPRFTSRYHQTLVWIKPIGDELTYVLQTDFSTQSDTNDFSGARDIGTSRWYGLNQYLMWKWSDEWTWGLNFEWFRDEGGFRVGALLPTLTTPASETRGLPIDRFGYQGNFFQFTFGPKWTPNPNLFVRPNLRWDWFDGEALNPGALAPYDDGTKDFQVILGTDVVILF